MFKLYISYLPGGPFSSNEELISVLFETFFYCQVEEITVIPRTVLLILHYPRNYFCIEEQLKEYKNWIVCDNRLKGVFYKKVIAILDRIKELNETQLYYEELNSITKKLAESLDLKAITDNISEIELN